MTDTTQANRITRARTNLLLDQPWFGVLALRLKVTENTAQETMQTNGTLLEYNPKWTARLTDQELVGWIGHETMHCAMQHPYRAAGRDLKRWNEAADRSINPLLRSSGLKLSADALVDDPAHANMSAEQIYALLKKEDEEKGDPQGQNRPEPTTGFTPAPAGANGDQPGDGTPGDQPGTQPSAGEGQEQMTATDWQVAAEQAASVSRKAGGMSGDVARAIKEARESQLDWKQILREFIENTVASDYSWTSPNRRYVGMGIYMPGVVKENVGRIAVAVDTSGSIGQALLDQFAGELSAIMQEAQPSAVDVIYCDSLVQGVETFTPDDGEITLKALGGGGTRFQPVMDWIAEQDEPPIGLVYATDLECSDTPVDPGCPVLWLTPEWVRQDGPFGETVRIPATAY